MNKIIKELIILANTLDKKGFRKEADFVDNLIKRASDLEFSELKKYIEDYNKRMSAMRSLMHNAFIAGEKETGKNLPYDARVRSRNPPFQYRGRIKAKIKKRDIEALTQSDWVASDWIQENIIKNARELSSLIKKIELIIITNNSVLEQLNKDIRNLDWYDPVYYEDLNAMIDGISFSDPIISPHYVGLYEEYNNWLKKLNLSGIDFYIQELIDINNKIKNTIVNKQEKVNELRTTGFNPSGE